MFSIWKKVFLSYWEKRLSARISAGGSVFVRDFVWDCARHWLLNAVAGPVSF